ncbi:hypothetical protein Tco_1548266 [Tanacetum coccineum]
MMGGLRYEGGWEDVVGMGGGGVVDVKVFEWWEGERGWGGGKVGSGGGERVWSVKELDVWMWIEWGVGCVGFLCGVVYGGKCEEGGGGEEGGEGGSGKKVLWCGVWWGFVICLFDWWFVGVRKVDGRGRLWWSEGVSLICGGEWIVGVEDGDVGEDVRDRLVGKWVDGLGYGVGLVCGGSVDVLGW